MSTNLATTSESIYADISDDELRVAVAHDLAKTATELLGINLDNDKYDMDFLDAYLHLEKCSDSLREELLMRF